MAGSTWEDMISLNSRAETVQQVLGPVRDYLSQDVGEVSWDKSRISLEWAVDKDPYPIPTTEQREGYYGPNHFNYWASGLRDYCQLIEWVEQNKIRSNTILDIGCASGRLIRHARNNFDEVIGCDINRQHVDWVGRYLDPSIKIFQNTSIPALPLPDASVDVVTAFSVFTHIECFDTTWLMELRRILRPGGIAWLTIHGDRTWRDIGPTWPLYGALTAHPDYPRYQGIKDLPEDRLIFRWHAERSYSANVFYTYEYIKKIWGRILPVRDIFPALPFFQDIVVLQKT
ncbi:Methyltransferase type 11 domain-containing protein [Paraburkholderia sacchari]|uniref:class I SAM-dependent methyltransferase n=1 Tax=Paraburkholderia sacchari TaxID=159450 RepID=UPI0039A6B330